MHLMQQHFFLYEIHIVKHKHSRTVFVIGLNGVNVANVTFHLS